MWSFKVIIEDTLATNMKVREKTLVSPDVSTGQRTVEEQRRQAP